MQIVIDIDENVFTRLFDNGIEDYEIAKDDLSAVAKAIHKGTPLPKGHGRLIDADDIREIELEDSLHIIQHKKGDGIDVYIDAPIIIEADNTENEG